ncbi:MAG: alpha/beta hydrolase [Actinomycetota bacterium]|nr:alpha/beta hydrolase [Actinomycetota bacterium]
MREGRDGPGRRRPDDDAAPWRRLLGEHRAVWELGALGVSTPALGLLPKGSRPVLVLPGLGASDRSTAPLRATLRRLGHHVHGWRLGTNRGPDDAALAGVRRRFDELVERHGEPIDLVGWSLGGIYARGLARRHPESVRLVVTLASPFREVERARGLEGRPLPVPSTSVWSRSDGIVPPEACVAEVVDERTENIRIRSSHLGMGFHPAAVAVVADRLAQAPGTWRHFDPPAALRAWYPDPRVPGRAGSTR